MSTVGASSALFTPGIGNINDSSPAVIQSFIDQHVDYNTPTTTITNLNVPDTPDAVSYTHLTLPTKA